MPFGFFVEVNRPDGGGGRPDQGLPGEQPGIDNSLPTPPPGIWPPPVPAHPIVPVPPGGSVPPGVIWPPVNPPRPDQGLPGQPPRPDNTLPGQQPGSQKYWVVVWIPGYGYRYVVVDPSLKPDQGLPGQGGRPDQSLPGSQPGPDNTLPTPPTSLPTPDNTLPPTAQPKR